MQQRGLFLLKFDLSQVEIRFPVGEDELDRYFFVRWQLLREPWGQPLGSERDDMEQSATHVCAIYKSELIGVGRLHLCSESNAQIRYMGIVESFRGNGIGGLMVSFIEDLARQKGCKRIILDARESAVRFYERTGFQAGAHSHTLFGDIKHVQMSKYLNEA